MTDHKDPDFSDFDPTPPGGWNKHWSSYPPPEITLAEDYKPEPEPWELVRWKQRANGRRFVMRWMEDGSIPPDWPLESVTQVYHVFRAVLNDADGEFEMFIAFPTPETTESVLEIVEEWGQIVQNVEPCGPAEAVPERTWIAES